MTGISKSQVSGPCVEIDERIGAVLDRPIEGDWPGRVGERGPNPLRPGQWPHLWIDATDLKVRAAGRIVSRDRQGPDPVGASEVEAFWVDFLRRPKRRGLAGVKLVISDAHEGIEAAVTRVFRATWQRCRVHSWHGRSRRSRGEPFTRRPRTRRGHP